VRAIVVVALLSLSRCLYWDPIVGPPGGAAFTLSGTASGVSAPGLGLKDTVSGATVTVSQSGTFSFDARFAGGAAYAIVVDTEPAGLTCAVMNGNGTIAAANVADITVTCSVGTSGTSGATGITAAGASGTPRLFFTDLQSGPGTGGDGNNGVYLTLYGLGFGATRGTSTVTIGGVEVASYARWGDPGPARGLETIVVQPGAAVVSGSVVVTVGGSASAGVQFTVRPGRIVFVSSSAQLAAAVTGRQDGDVIYLRAGTYGATTPACSATAILALDETDAPTPSLPVAFIGYPGEVAQLGDAAAPPKYGVCINYAAGGSTSKANFVFARLLFTHAVNATASAVGRARFIGNTFSQTSQTDQDTGVIVVGDNAFNMRIWGNHFSQTGASANARGAIWFAGLGATDQIRDVDIAWNELDTYQNDSGVTLNANFTTLQVDTFYVHDNFFHDAPRSGVAIDLDANLTSTSKVDVYNNVFKGTTDGAIWVTSNATQASIRVEHNTCYHDGVNNYGFELSFGAASGLKGSVLLRNNIVNPIGAAYMYAQYISVMPTEVTASKNLYIDGAVASGYPGGDSASKYTPQTTPFASTQTFELDPSSEAIDGGDAATFVTTDFYGRARTAGSGPDVGAVERVP
jgi:hypothetical protein